MDEEVGEHRFLQRCVECLDQAVRQATDKSDRVCQKQGLLVREMNPSSGRVERRKQFVLDQHVRTREPAKERRFAGIRVPDDRRVGHRGPLTVLALGSPGRPDLLEFAAQPVDLVAEPALVLLQLTFAFTPAADPAALSDQVTPGAGQARERILGAGQLDLKTGFTGLGTACKNIENDFLPVDDRAARQRLPISLLRWGELVVEDNQIETLILRTLRNLLSLARPNEITRLQFPVLSEHLVANRNAKSCHEFPQFFEETGGFVPSGGVHICTYQESAGWSFRRGVRIRHSATPT
jgi:hypothetical protein